MKRTEREAELHAEGARVAENCEWARRRIGRDRYLFRPTEPRPAFAGSKLQRLAREIAARRAA